VRNGSVFFYDFEFMQKYIDRQDCPFEYVGVPELECYELPLGYEKALFKYRIHRWSVSIKKYLNVVINRKCQ
ncbi:hypothetical protein RCJ22_14820, partial [Vibrio sp. FNV 38]|nr:hypothetical protein [Vibrio sp. FNV 38]